MTEKVPSNNQEIINEYKRKEQKRIQKALEKGERYLEQLAHKRAAERARKNTPRPKSHQ